MSSDTPPRHGPPPCSQPVPSSFLEAAPQTAIVRLAREWLSLLAELKQQRAQVAHLENVMHDRLLAGVANARARGFASSLHLMAYDLADLKASGARDMCAKCIIHAEAATHLPDAIEVRGMLKASISRDIENLQLGAQACAMRAEICSPSS